MKKFELIKNQSGGENLIYDDYIYNKDKKLKEKTRWRCQSRDCTSDLFVMENEDILVDRVHNHPPNNSKILKIKALNLLKEKSKIAQIDANTMITTISTSLNDDVLKIFPSYKSLNDKIVKQRKKEIVKFELEYSDFPNVLKYNLLNELFLQYDSGFCDMERVVMFYTDFSKNWIKKAKTWLIDGTFWCVPAQFTQMITIHGLLFGKTYPLVYMLLKSKRESAYKKAFLKIKELFAIDPINICIDFEKGLYNSCNEAFEGVNLKGCNFHFVQCVWRKVPNLGLQKDFSNNLNVRKQIKMCLNLAFVPENRINFEYDKIVLYYKETTNKALTDFFDYFKNTFISQVNDGVENDGLFKKRFWSSYECIKNNLPRTTNTVESWHRSFNQRFRTAHPNISHFFDELKKEEETVRIKLIQASAGNVFSMNKNLVKEENLRNIISSYDLYEGFDFFNALDSVHDWKLDE